MDNQELLKLFFSGDFDKFSEAWLESDHGHLITEATLDADEWVDEQVCGIDEWLHEQSQEGLGEPKRLILADKIKAEASDYDIIVDEIDKKLIWQDDAAFDVRHCVPTKKRDIWNRKAVVCIATHADNAEQSCHDCEIHVTDEYMKNYGMDIPDGWVCKNCAENYGTCDDCGDLHHSDNLHYNDNRGCSYCDNCNPNELDEIFNDLIVPRQPANPRHVGFELESCFRSPKLWKAPSYQHVQRVYHDSSIESDDRDCTAEVCVQPTNDFVALRKVVDAISEAGGYTNSTCGGHIHVDARDLQSWFQRDATFHPNDKTVMLCKMFAPIQPLMFALSEQDRITNTYCRWTLRNGDNANDRYRAMNLQAFYKGTLEFRLFSGSHNFDELKLRGQICAAFVQKMSEVINKYGTVKGTPVSTFQLQYEGAVEFGDRPAAQEWLETHPIKVKEYIQATMKYLGLTEADAELANTLYKKYWR